MFVFDGDPAFQWSVEGEVASFSATLYDDQGSVVHSGGVNGNSLNIGASALEPGRVYTLEIVAQPASGGEATSSTFSFRVAAPVTEAPTEAPTETPASGAIDRNSDPASIEALQQKLFELGLFSADNAPQRGTFDQRTLEIVLSFQQAYNAQNPGAPLIEVDPANPDTVIDATTVALIMSAGTSDPEVPMG